MTDTHALDGIRIVDLHVFQGPVGMQLLGYTDDESAALREQGAFD